MGIMSSLLRFARSIVQGVLNQITQQMNVVQESAMSPINQMVQSVTNGVWRGKGADAFVQEMQSEVLPAFGSLLTGIGSTNTHINKAIEIMHAADTNGASKVNSLVDVFRSIF
jgi:hypothetical protein